MNRITKTEPAPIFTGDAKDGYPLNLIRVKGYSGTWCVLDVCERNGKSYYLLEHEQDAKSYTRIIIEGLKEDALIDPVYNGFEDLDRYLDNQLDTNKY